ncbi:MAG: hypothetical protein E5W93_14160 [Mesorhizobium sp.]|nr:MAG: hypothetical protein E5W93_14160 [Mesorhizobium sp.]
MAAKRPDEGCFRENRRLTSLEHPSSVSALRADPPSPTRGEGYSSHKREHASGICAVRPSCLSRQFARTELSSRLSPN